MNQNPHSKSNTMMRMRRQFHGSNDLKDPPDIVTAAAEPSSAQRRDRLSYFRDNFCPEFVALGLRGAARELGPGRGGGDIARIIKNIIGLGGLFRVGNLMREAGCVRRLRGP